MRKNLFLAGLLIIGLISCKKQQEDTEDTQVSTEFVDEHTAQKSLDWRGEYQGVLPCADCDEIKTTIVLNPNQTFYSKQEYIKGSKSEIFESNGNFSWDETGFIITIQGDERFRRSFKVVENAIIYLNNERDKTVTDYRLTKR